MDKVRPIQQFNNRRLINLLPDELIRTAVDPKKLLGVFLAILFLVLLVAGYGIFLYKSIRAGAELARLQKVTGELQPDVRRLESLKSQKAELEKALLDMEGLASMKAVWSPVIAEINSNLPAETWLTSLQFYFDQEGAAAGNAEGGKPPQNVRQGQGDGKQGLPAVMPVPNSVLIKGESGSLLPVSAFAGRLLKAKCFADVRINEIQEDRESGLLLFSFTARLSGGER